MNDRSPYFGWHKYFDERCAVELEAPYDEQFADAPGREAIARSVERFELGESGDGANLKRLATATGDSTYARTIELFVDEEGQHARWLGVLRERFGGTKLESHWTDAVFVMLRHIGGLRREICVLLTAEIVALSYYRVLALAYDDGVLRAACDRILRDERGHVAFHRAALGCEFSTMPGPMRTLAVLTWRAFVAVTAKVVAWDHREVLALAGVSRRDFEIEVRGRARRLARAIRSGSVLPVVEPAR